jgi:hypothetical protein
MSITVEADAASDSWGFVGVVRVGQSVAYRTVEAFPTPSDAVSEMQSILSTVLGELLAGAEWRRVREQTGAIPTRRDLGLGVLKHPRRQPVAPAPVAPDRLE